MDLAGPGINENDGAALGVFFEDLLADALEILVKGRDDVVPRNGWLGDPLGGFPSLGIVSDMEAPGLSLELEVEGLLDPLAPFALGKDQVLVLDRARGEGGLFAGVADDVGGQFAVGVKTGIDLLELQIRGESSTCGGEFLGPEVLDERKGKKRPVTIVGEDCLIAERDGAAQKALGKGDLLTREGEGLCIVPVGRGGELQDKIVAQAVLGKGIAVAVGDLASRCRDAQLECPGLFLGLPRGFGIFIHRLIGPEGLGAERSDEEGRRRDEQRQDQCGAEVHRVAAAGTLGAVMWGGFK